MLNQTHITDLHINETAKIIIDENSSLDEAFISPSGEGAPFWNGKKLLDLPDLLLSHQVAEGQPGAGSFYMQFQHNESSLNGYTEDMIFSALGLIAESWANSDIDLETAILAAREVLLEGINSEERDSLGAPLFRG